MPSREKESNHSDPLSPEERSHLMSLVRSRDTKPEMRVRKCVFALGYRYRLHCRDLAGCPDLVFRKQKKIIFVHGCFWHRHAKCPRCRTPKTRVEFWGNKLDANATRDRKVQRKLRAMGWRIMVIWECQTQNEAKLTRRIVRFLEETRKDEIS